MAMIKYLGSKRRLVPVLGDICAAVGATRTLDLFTGTTRVAQEFKRRGADVTAVDTARYAHVFARCYVELDADGIDERALADAFADLTARPGIDGYVTETFCRQSRFFQAHNGMRIDAIRDAIEHDYRDSWMYPVLLTSLIEAADRVDSTTGVQMAYVKQWAARSHNELELRRPELLEGAGAAYLGDACELAGELGAVRLGVHRPAVQPASLLHELPHLGDTRRVGRARALRRRVQACRRARRRDQEPIQPAPGDAGRARAGHCDRRRRSRRGVVQRRGLGDDRRPRSDVRGPRRAVRTLAFESKRYVGAQIGIHNPRGEKVGRVSHLHNVEYVVVAGDPERVERVVASQAAGASAWS